MGKEKPGVCGRHGRQQTTVKREAQGTGRQGKGKGWEVGGKKKARAGKGGNRCVWQVWHGIVCGKVGAQVEGYVGGKGHGKGEGKIHNKGGRWEGGEW